MPTVLAPADSPSENDFKLADVAVESETNLRSAFDDVVDEPEQAAQPAAGGAGAGAP